MGNTNSALKRVAPGNTSAKSGASTTSVSAGTLCFQAELVRGEPETQPSVAPPRLVAAVSTENTPRFLQKRSTAAAERPSSRAGHSTQCSPIDLRWPVTCNDWFGSFLLLAVNQLPLFLTKLASPHQTNAERGQPLPSVHPYARNTECQVTYIR